MPTNHNKTDPAARVREELARELFLLVTAAAAQDAVANTATVPVRAAAQAVAALRQARAALERLADD